MPGHKKKRSRKKRGAGWVKDRLKYDTDPSDLYPLKRKEDMFPDSSTDSEDDTDPEPFEDQTYRQGQAENLKAAYPSDDTASAPEKGSVHKRQGSEEKSFAGEADSDDGFENADSLKNADDSDHTDNRESVYSPDFINYTEIDDDAEHGDEAEFTDDADRSLRESADSDEAEESDDDDRQEDTKKVKPDLSTRFRRFWTRERIDDARMVVRTAVAGSFAVLFLMPIVLTITNSLMTKSEINANYGVIFAKKNGVRVFISNTVNLKFIPDIVSFEQYFKVLILSPEYLLKFWNSFLYVVPIVVFQLAVASLASYGFARYRGKVREVIFFSYIILMLMPYQVTLVPNYLVSNWLNIIDTRWAIWLPGFFSPFAVYMLTKYMRRIPKSIYEAAEIDGAGEWQIFTRICLPNCRGGLASIAILLFIDYWNMVEQPLILLSNDQLHPLSVFLSKINSGEISLAFAVAVIYMVLPMMVFLYGEEYLVEGIVYQGGIKE
ncbi:MAG: carbohydrate ABC transporter permease [Lachnospiraceae bacterium]|nr:carbohydrate ABC transporter permease [Lachnospiraceae bacterium]